MSLHTSVMSFLLLCTGVTIFYKMASRTPVCMLPLLMMKVKYRRLAIDDSAIAGEFLGHGLSFLCSQSDAAGVQGTRNAERWLQCNHFFCKSLPVRSLSLYSSKP